MSFRKMIFVLTITVSAIFLITIGSSYAYYESSDEVDISVTTSDDIPITTVFSGTDYINIRNAIPVLPQNVLAEASKSVFTITPDSSLLPDYEVAVKISLANIRIDSDLRVEDFKIRLVTNNECVNDSNENSFEYDGTEIIENTLDLATIVLNGECSIDSDFEYSTNTIYVWIDDTGLDQNELMNKNFNATIKVDTVSRKKNANE